MISPSKSFAFAERRKILDFAMSAQHPRKDYKFTKNTNIMSAKILVDQQDIINTYSKGEQFSCKKYFEYKKLIKENPKYGYKKCAKLLGVPQGRTRWWHTKGKKKARPLALKVVQKLKEAKLISFTEKHKDAKIIFNMLGVLFGDGGVDKRLNTVAFISADIRDINFWKKDFIKIFPFAKEKIQIIEGGEYGHSYNIRCWDRAVIRFFVALGTPVGDKVTIHYSLPKWIFDVSTKSRIAFLDGYLASEISIPVWRILPYKNFYFANFAFGVSKVLELEKEHISFLRNLEKLLASVKIETTKNIHKNLSAGRIRKDGLQTANYRIFIRTKFNQVLFFNKQFALRYAKAKKERLEKEVKIAREHKELNSN